MFSQNINALKKLLKTQLSQKDRLHITEDTIIGLVNRIIQDVIKPHFYEVDSKPAFWLKREELEMAMETLVAIEETILETATPDEVSNYFHPVLRKIDFVIKNQKKIIEEGKERVREDLKI